MLPVVLVSLNMRGKIKMSSGFTSIYQDDSPDNQRCPICEHSKEAHSKGKCGVKGCYCKNSFVMVCELTLEEESN